MPETFQSRLQRVSNSQKRSFVVSPDDYRIGEDGLYRVVPELEVAIWRMAHETFRAILSRSDMDKAVALVGIPGAGKSTWLASHKEPRTVYFDATMATTRTRLELTVLAESVGKPIEALWINTPLDVCLQRNQTRTPDRMVPEPVLQRMALSLMDTPPNCSEGFSRISRVSP